MKSKRISFLVSLSLAAFAVLALLSAACGGDDDSSSKTTSAGGSKTASAVATGGGNATGSGIKDLQAAAKDFKTTNFKITYEITNTDDAGKARTGTMVMAQKGASTLFSANGLTDEDSGSVTIIDDGKNNYMCADAQKTCIKSTSTGSSADSLGLFSPADLLSGLDQDGETVDKVADQTIAGRSAKCYKATGADGGGVVCLDKKTNVLLSVDGSDSDGTKIKFVAKSVSDSPSDNDFKPPFAVQTVPSN
ncbi:MAG: hypothetical protein ABI305_04135 [Tepidiformaceae bacterium]